MVRSKGQWAQHKGMESYAQKNKKSKSSQEEQIHFF